MKRYIVWIPDIRGEVIRWNVYWDTDSLSEAVASWKEASEGYEHVLLTALDREHLDT